MCPSQPSGESDSAPALLITCEHAANAVPARWAPLFESPAARRALDSHRGWDPGAASLARALRPQSRAPLVRRSLGEGGCLLGTATRLLVELNRSPGHPQFWSEFTRGLSPAEKAAVFREIYAPFRRAALREIRRLCIAANGPVFHLSVHSFTPELDGETRDADIGLLYDPARPLEVRWADAWDAALRSLAPEWRIRRNFPYAGTDDGHVTHLRTLFSPDAYAGMELEVNQSLLTDSAHRAAVGDRLRRAFPAAVPLAGN